jgi:hypothetical protein
MRLNMAEPDTITTVTLLLVIFLLFVASFPKWTLPSLSIPPTHFTSGKASILIKSPSINAKKARKIDGQKNIEQIIPGHTPTDDSMPPLLVLSLICPSFLYGFIRLYQLLLPRGLLYLVTVSTFATGFSSPR